MHVEGWRARAQQVVVHGGHLQAFGEEFRHHGIDLGLGQNEIAHHHGLVAHGREGDPSAQGEAGLELDTVKADLEIEPRKAVTVNRAADSGGPSENEIDFRPIRFGGAGRRKRQRRNGQYQRGVYPTHRKTSWLNNRKSGL